MALPEPFNDVEHFQTVVRRYCNRSIREDFRDLMGEAGNWEPSISTTREAMLKALLHEDSDPLQLTVGKMMLYYFTYGKASALQSPIFGTPVQDYQETFKYHPQVKLYVIEDADDVDKDYRPIRSEITFRLMNETENTITETKARTIANRIKTNFCTGGGFRWKRGRETWMYVDLEKGYRFKLFAWSEAEAKNVIEQVLDIQGHAPNWDDHLFDAAKRKHLQTTSPIPKTERIYGKNRRLPRKLPVAYVRFRWAELFVWGLARPVTLIDRSGFRKNPLVEA